VTSPRKRRRDGAVRLALIVVGSWLSTHAAARAGGPSDRLASAVRDRVDALSLLAHPCPRPA